MLKKILAEPLIHFVLLALLFFVIHGLVNPESLQGSNKITISSLRIEQLKKGFEKTWTRTPDQQELKKLIDDYVLDEIYSREAKLIGLAENDAVVRKRLRQKMEFMLQDVSSLQEPDDKTLRIYYEKRKGKYIQEARYSFTQMYISPDKNKAQLKQVVELMTKELQQGNIPKTDNSMLAKQIVNNTEFQVDRQFGEGFSLQLNVLTLKQWSKPIRSGLGYHIVNVSERKLDHPKTLENVRAQLIVDWKYEQSQLFQLAYEQELLEKYEIEIVNAEDQQAALSTFKG